MYPSFVSPLPTTLPPTRQTTRIGQILPVKIREAGLSFREEEHNCSSARFCTETGLACERLGKNSAFQMRLCGGGGERGFCGRHGVTHEWGRRLCLWWVNLSKLLNSMMIMTRDDSNKSISQLSSRSIIQVSQLANLLERACPSSPSPKTIEIEKLATLGYP